jgi:hypothetical protein
MLVSQPVWAGWVELGASGPVGNERTVYFDPPSLTKAKCLKGTLLMRQWIVAVLFSIVSASAWAQEDQVLRGFASARLVIEDLDEEAMACGVTRSALDTSARFVLSQSRIKFDSAARPFIYIKVTVMRLSSSDSCAYSYEMSFRAPARVSANNIVAYVEIWSGGGMGISPRSNMPKSLTEGIEITTKKFVVEWSKTN